MMQPNKPWIIRHLPRPAAGGTPSASSSTEEAGIENNAHAGDQEAASKLGAVFTMNVERLVKNLKRKLEEKEVARNELARVSRGGAGGVPISFRFVSTVRAAGEGSSLSLLALGERFATFPRGRLALRDPCLTPTSR